MPRADGTDLKAFKDYIRNNFCHDHTRARKCVTNSWDANDHEIVTKAFLIIKHSPLDKKEKWDGFYSFIVKHSLSEEWGGGPIWANFLDVVAMKYLISKEVSDNDILQIKKLIEIERELSVRINKISH